MTSFAEKTQIVNLPVKTNNKHISTQYSGHSHEKTSFISALSIGVLSISMAFASPADAVNQVRENSVQVLKILNSGDANTARQKAEAYAIPYFDFQRMTALAVGNPWRTATDAQKQALTKEFQTLLIRTYSGTMLKFKMPRSTSKTTLS